MYHGDLRGSQLAFQTSILGQDLFQPCLQSVVPPLQTVQRCKDVVQAVLHRGAEGLPTRRVVPAALLG